MGDRGEVKAGSFWAERDLIEKVVQTSPVGIAVVDSNGLVTYANNRAEEIYGRSREAITEFSHDDSRWDLIDEDGRPLDAGEAPFDRVIEREEAFYDQILGLRRPSGERVWVSVNGAPQRNENSELEYAVFAFEDITEQRSLEGELNEILGRVTDAVYALDEEFRFTHVNERAEELLQASEDELIGEKLWDMYPEFAQIDDVWNAFHTAMDIQESQSYDLYYDPLDFWVESTIYPSETGASVYFRDVIERKERETERAEMIRELKESEERLQLALEAGEMGTWELVLQTEDSPIRSPHHDRIFGYEEPREDWDFETFLEHVHPDDRQEVKQGFEDAFETGSWEFECRIKRADGEHRAISAQGEFYYNNEGEPARAVGIVQDITERKEREVELERALGLLERTERIADVGGWEIDVDSQEVFWTDHIFELLEVDAEEEPPLDEALAMYHNEDQSIVEAAVEQALDSGEPFDIEARIHTENNTVRWLRIQGVPETVDHEVVLLRGAAQDVTERKRREQRLEEVVDRLEESNQRLEQFAYAASHDLQEPLRMVSSYLQLIETRYNEALDDDGIEFLEYAVDSADRMREMIDGLLKYSRVETQGESFESVGLDGVFEDVREDLRAKIEESGTDITVDELPCVRGDPGQLRQVFQNLLDNAIEYSGNEPPRIHVSAERNGTEWVLSVRDEGIGIEPEYADSIFQVFNRLHSNDEYSGTGIGLALCERIVERHRGEIWVGSTPGEGATFSFTLPAASGHET